MRVSIIGLVLILAVSACSSKEGATFRGRVDTPSVTGPAIDLESVPPGGTTSVTLSNGAEISIQRFGGKLLYRMEGTFTPQAFNQIQSLVMSKPEAERRAVLQKEINDVFGKIAAVGAIPSESVASAGYFSFFLPYEKEGLDLFRALKLVSNDIRDIRVEPSVYVKQMDPSAGDAVAADASFSGLERLGIPAFIQQAEQDIGGGVQVNGSAVTVGVADTGITYNHPIFADPSNPARSRIHYMNDSSGEGMVYINTAAKFQAAAGASDEDLLVNAEVITTPKLPALPAGDKFSVLDQLKMKVSPELRKILLDPASGAKLGIFFEDVLQGGEGAVDINHNGKLDDKLYVIYLPAAKGRAQTVYFDSSGTADFRNATPVTDFNQSGATISVFAERIGFVFGTAKLPSADGQSALDMTTLTFVGYDPGNHGTHVAGIAAGGKVIANDPDGTLARGISSGSTIALNRVCTNNAGCRETKGVADLSENANVDVINLSIGGLSAFNDGSSVEETLIDRISTMRNITFMISAGNEGPGRQTVGSPSLAKTALSIGASASKSLIQKQYQWPGTGGSDDFMLFFSSRGPTASGGFKPNLVAPGSELSSIQLNSAPGSRAGMDVYWGTSMAAPSATGSFALFLDAIRKYNDRHPAQKLPTDGMMLRRILIETARPFDANRFDPATGEKTEGQYTWADQGTGMINLLAAWKKVFEVRDSMPASAVTLNGVSVELDYQVITSGKAANGNAYDGTRVENTGPVYGSGLYLRAEDTDRFHPVYVMRKLPDLMAGCDSAGDLTRQLETTADEFVLRTVYYGEGAGAGHEWLKAGVMDEMDCQTSPTNHLRVLGVGVAIGVKDGKGVLSSTPASQLNVCLLRDKIAALAPGDHGALIYAYRTVAGKVAPVASFIVPVYMTVPNQTMAASAGFELSDTVPSFGVKRNYVLVPKGVSVLRIQLEVPPVKTDASGSVAQGETCSGVELMAYEGGNTYTALPSRPAARISNCDEAGRPIADPAKRTLIVNRTLPRAGMWDVHVFGQYRFAKSQYKLKVDYVLGETDLKSIEGDLAALNGTVTWTLKESSFAAQPDATQSAIELNGLYEETKSQVANSASVFVANSLGALRSYPKDATQVTITTGGSAGNDIDLNVLECPADATSPEDSRCTKAGSSGTATDEEKVTLTPKAGMLYAVQVNGFKISSGDGMFTSSETISLAAESKPVEVVGSLPSLKIGYNFMTADSKILANPLFTGGKRIAVGTLTLRMANGSVLAALPVKIHP